MALGKARIFGCDANVTPAPWIVGLSQFLGLGHHQPTAADTEVERSVDFRKIEFHQHVITDNTELSAAEGDKGGNVETADPNDLEAGMIAVETQLTRPAFGECRLIIGSSSQAGLGLEVRLSFLTKVSPVVTDSYRLQDSQKYWRSFQANYSGGLIPSWFMKEAVSK